MWKEAIPLPKKGVSFEENLAQLEALVQKMEQGGLTLQESLASYEQGMALAAGLTKELDAAQKRMQELVNGKPVPMEDAP